MRMLKGFGIAMLVAVMVVGFTVSVAAKKGEDAAVSVNASFSIPSWISLSVVGNGDVSFGDVAGPGSYKASNNTSLLVLSTTNWTITDTILWSESTMPEGASQQTIERTLERSYDQASGSWGIHNVNVSYNFELGVEDMANMPTGDYNLVIQYTATTD